jgi:adenosylcobinamide amidohydrolase
LQIDTFYNNVELHREDKILYARFLSPHRVISTCQVAGGIREDLEYLYNHQSCEPTAHHSVASDIIKKDRAAYREEICQRHHLDPEKCATLGTAANMRYAAIKQYTFRELTVAAVCTGGVETNAGRAGDPASYYEHDGIFEKVGEKQPEPAGTINTLLFINRELTPGTLARTIMTATEAKTTVLQELGVTSRYSDGHATGTGTDQIGVACRLNTGKPLTSAGKHGKLGECIGRAVHDAVKETLAQQNGLLPQTRRTVEALLERFGVQQDDIRQQVTAYLEKDDALVWNNNYAVILQDSMVVTSVAALTHIRDKIVWGTIPENCLAEILASFGAQVSASVSGKYQHLDHYRTRHATLSKTLESTVFIDSISRMLAVGFSDKWREKQG